MGSAVHEAKPHSAWSLKSHQGKQQITSEAYEHLVRRMISQGGKKAAFGVREVQERGGFIWDAQERM